MVVLPAVFTQGAGDGMHNLFTPAFSWHLFPSRGRKPSCREPSHTNWLLATCCWPSLCPAVEQPRLILACVELIAPSWCAGFPVISCATRANFHRWLTPCPPSSPTHTLKFSAFPKYLCLSGKRKTIHFSLFLELRSFH